MAAKPLFQLEQRLLYARVAIAPCNLYCQPDKCLIYYPIFIQHNAYHAQSHVYMALQSNK